MIRFAVVITSSQGMLAQLIDGLCRSGRRAGMCLFVVCLSLATAATASTEPAQTSGVEAEHALSETEMVEKYTESIAVFVESISGGKVEDIRFLGIEEHRLKVFPEARFSVNRSQPERKAEVSVDVESGLPVGYLWLWLELESKGVPLTQAVTEARAFEAAAPILRYYGLPDAVTDYVVEPPSADNPVNGLFLNEWVFRRQFEYQGLPCRNTGIFICVSSFSGSVHSVKYVAPVEPEPVATVISRADAVDRARQYLPQSRFGRSIKIWLPPTAVRETRQVIAFPNSNFDDIPSSAGISRSKAYLCWEVPFEWHVEDHNALAVLWITVDAGVPIGGDGRGQAAAARPGN